MPHTCHCATECATRARNGGATQPHPPLPHGAHGNCDQEGGIGPERSGRVAPSKPSVRIAHGFFLEAAHVAHREFAEVHIYGSDRGGSELIDNTDNTAPWW